jgi:hypothetical protein
VSRNIFSGSLSIVACTRSSFHCFSTLSVNSSLRTRDDVSKLRQFPFLEAQLLNPLALKKLVLKKTGRFTISPDFGSSLKVSTVALCILC